MRTTIGFMLLLGWMFHLTVTNAQEAQSARSQAMEYCMSVTGGEQEVCERNVYGKGE